MLVLPVYLNKTKKAKQEKRENMSLVRPSPTCLGDGSSFVVVVCPGVRMG